MKSLIFFLVLFVFLMFGTNNILACSCLPAKSAIQELEQSTAVFSGKVVVIKRHKKAENIFGSVEVILRVDKTWKGVKRRTISVFTSSNSAACGYNFRVNQTYLVYANGNDEGKLSTGLCSRTKRLKDAREDLRELSTAKNIALVYQMGEKRCFMG